MAATSATLLADYERQYAADPLTADRSLLSRAKQALQEEGAAGPDHEQIYRGLLITRYSGQRQPFVALVSTYLQVPLPADEEAWARWQLVDHLAMLGRCEDTVREHQALLAWARLALPPDQLPWVMHDSTQSFCWARAGQLDAWLAIFEELREARYATAENRLGRFYYLRTVGETLGHHGRAVQALPLAARIQALADEEPTWEHAWWVRLEADLLELFLQREQGRAAAVRRLGQHIGERLAATAEGLSPAPGRSRAVRLPHRLGAPELDPGRRLAVLYDSAATILYWAKHHDLAIPLFERELAHDATSGWAMLRLAASYWATTKDRARVLPLLQQAAHRLPEVSVAGLFGGDLPEFQDVVGDPDFLRAANVAHVGNEKV